MGQPLFLYRSNFFRHYTNQLALPFPVLRNLTPAQVARLQEHPSTPPGVDLVLPTSGVLQAIDRQEREVLVFESDWVMRYTFEKNPKVEFRETI